MSDQTKLTFGDWWREFRRFRLESKARTALEIYTRSHDRRFLLEWGRYKTQAVALLLSRKPLMSDVLAEMGYS